MVRCREIGTTASTSAGNAARIAFGSHKTVRTLAIDAETVATPQTSFGASR